jgi:hypothetical protein
MKREIDYAHLSGDAKREKAVQDCKDYVGDDRVFKDLVTYVSGCDNLSQVHNALSMFLGIEGYPATAMWETYRDSTKCWCDTESYCTCGNREGNNN